MSKDYYKILGVAEFDSAENIKSAYRKLARKWHPDIAGNSKDVLYKFKEINEAYEILSNDVKKAEYDKARRFYNYANNNINYKNTEPKSKNNFTNPQTKSKNFNFNWEEFLGRKNREESFKKSEEKDFSKRGEDISTDIEITALEALNGVTKVINMLQSEICPNCKGKKFVNGSTCSKCNGKGEFTNYKKFSVKIPAGVKNYSKIRLSGEGCVGKNGGKNGDLYINIKIKEMSDYNLDGLNVLKTVSVTPSQAVLGTNLKISSINGNIKLKIAPNTQNGQKIRLTGCGIVQNEKIGDMIVTVEINIPKNISGEELELYKKLEEISQNKINRD